MRSAIVPAQITTIEDKVTGNLSMSQLLLLSAPIFTSGLIYLAFPPILGSALYKTILMLVVAAISLMLAVRIKGRIALLWVITIGRYNLRPRHFVFDKNDPYLRDIPSGDVYAEEADGAEAKPAEVSAPMPKISFADTVFLEQIMADPKANLHFKTDRKGDLHVRINQDR